MLLIKLYQEIVLYHYKFALPLFDNARVSYFNIHLLFMMLFLLSKGYMLPCFDLSEQYLFG